MKNYLILNRNNKSSSLFYLNSLKLNIPNFSKFLAFGKVIILTKAYVTKCLKFINEVKCFKIEKNNYLTTCNPRLYFEPNFFIYFLNIDILLMLFFL